MSSSGGKRFFAKEEVNEEFVSEGSMSCERGGSGGYEWSVVAAMTEWW